MQTKFISTMLIVTAVAFTFGPNEAKAAFSAQVGSPNVSFSISDYQPAPPNVYVLSDGGRPYYMQRDRRVYMEKRRHGKRHYKEDRHHDDNGRGNGHGKHDRRD